MTDVCLIFPKQIGLKEPTAYPPLGLLYIAGNLLENNITVSVVNHITNKLIPHASFYGIYTCNASYQSVKKLVAYLKEHRPSSHIVLGGPQCTSFPYKVLEDTGVDYVEV